MLKDGSGRAVLHMHHKALSSKLWYISRGSSSKDVIAEVKAAGAGMMGAGRPTACDIFLKGNTRYCRWEPVLLGMSLEWILCRAATAQCTGTRRCLQRMRFPLMSLTPSLPMPCSHHFSNPRPDFHGQGDVRGKSFQIYRGQQPVAEVRPLSHTACLEAAQATMCLSPCVLPQPSLCSHAALM